MEEAKVKEFDIVNMAGKPDAKLRILHKAERMLSGRRKNDYKVPVHSGIALKDPKDGKLKVLDLTTQGLKFRKLTNIKNKYNVPSVTRLNLSDQEKNKLKSSIYKDFKTKSEGYTVSGLAGQFLFNAKAKKNKSVCSQYVSKKIRNNTRYSFALQARKTKPVDLENPANFVRDKNVFKNPGVKVVKNPNFNANQIVAKPL